MLIFRSARNPKRFRAVVFSYIFFYWLMLKWNDGNSELQQSLPGIWHGFLISGFDEDTKQQGIPMENTDHRAEQFIVDVPGSR